MKKLILTLSSVAILATTLQASDKVCPAGYKLPTEAEFNALSMSNISDAFNELKLTLAGRRNRTNASVYADGNYAYYWTSDVSASNIRFIHFTSISARFYSDNRAYGFSVRCKKI
jgi:hypothetical protein